MSVTTLEDAVEHLDLAPVPDDLRRALAARDRLDAQIALAVADYETAGHHQADGARTMTAWLRHHTGRDPQAAAKLVVAGRKLHALPHLCGAVLAGRISGGQLDAILTNVPMRHLERFAEHEPELVPRLVDLDVDQTRRAMTAWRRHADAIDEPAPPGEHDDELHLSTTIAGRGEVRGSFGADLTALFEAALRVADPKDFEVSLAQRRASALGQVCQFFLDHQQARTGGRHRPHLNVVLTYEELQAELGGRYVDTDQPVSPATLGSLLCDSVYHRLLWSARSGILDYGRATRAWPVDLYNAIALRDGGCRFPGCDAPPSWCDIHHATFWTDGGTTSIDTGFMGCRYHHHLGHTDGYEMKLLPDGTVEVTFPDGHTERSYPRGPTPQNLWDTGPPQHR